MALLVPRNYLFDFLNAFVIASCVGLVVAYLGSVIRVAWRNDLNGEHYFVLAICGIAAVLATRHSWQWAWRALGKPDWMEDHILLAFTLWVLFTMLLMLLMARDVVKGNIPRESWRWFGIVIALGVALGLCVVVFMEPSPVVPIEP